MIRLLRRAALAAASLALVALVASAAWAADISAPQPGDMAMGDPHAPVTVIEYGSVGCPHCAAWANEVFPAFKAKFIDTGKVRFVNREMTTGDATLAAAGFLLARCAGPGKYFQVVDEIYRHQASMFQPGSSPLKVLEDIGRGAGLDAAAFDACLDDKAALAALNARVQRHVDDDKVDSTPTFFVNGQKLEGDQPLDRLAAAIHAARRRR